MNNETLKASVNYGDFSGTVAADRHDQEDISKLAKKYGIDTERYFVIGVTFRIGEIRDDKKMPSPYVSILAVDSHQVKAYGVDALQDYIDNNDGCLPYSRLDIKATLEEVLLSFKRFEVVLSNSHIKRVVEYQQNDDS